MHDSQPAGTGNRNFLRNELAQDLAEYCLLTALVALIALGIFWRMSGGIENLWGNTNTALANGNTAAFTGATAGAGSAPAGSSTTSAGK